MLYKDRRRWIGVKFPVFFPSFTPGTPDFKDPWRNKVWNGYCWIPWPCKLEK